MLAQVLVVLILIGVYALIAQLAACHTLTGYGLSWMQCLLTGSATVIFVGFGVWLLGGLIWLFNFDVDQLSLGAQVLVLLGPQIMGFFAAMLFIRSFIMATCNEEVKHFRSAGIVFGILMKFIILFGVLKAFLIAGLFALDSSAGDVTLSY